jgi:hypothetical protein
VTHATTALEQALYYYDRREALDKQARYDAAVALGAFGIFSARQIAGFVGISHQQASALIGKKDRTGGRLNPLALRPLLEISQQWAREELDNASVVAALDAGVSTWLAARLSGIPRSTLMRRYVKGKEQDA